MRQERVAAPPAGLQTLFGQVPARIVLQYANTMRQEWAAARRQMTGEELSDAYRQIGSAAAQLYMMHFPAFGELAANGDVHGDQPYPAALQEHAWAVIRSARLRNLFCSALEKRRPLFLDVQRASLCHEDLHRHNILFRRHQGRWRLATILATRRGPAIMRRTWPGLSCGKA